MSAVPVLQELIDARSVWHAGRSTRTQREAEPTGHAALDALLPSGGWPRNSLSELLIPHDGIGEDQPSLGVGVADLDGLAGHAGDDVARAVAVAVGHVLDRHGDADQVDRQLHADRGDEGAEHGGRAAHVVLHFLDAALGLQVDAAGIEGDALADQGEGFVILLAALVVEHDHPRRLSCSVDTDPPGLRRSAGRLCFEPRVSDLRTSNLRWAACRGWPSSACGRASYGHAWPWCTSRW